MRAQLSQYREWKRCILLGVQALLEWRIADYMASEFWSKNKFRSTLRYEDEAGDLKEHTKGGKDCVKGKEWFIYQSVRNDTIGGFPSYEFARKWKAIRKKVIDGGFPSYEFARKWKAISKKVIGCSDRSYKPTINAWCEHLLRLDINVHYIKAAEGFNLQMTGKSDLALADILDEFIEADTERANKRGLMDRILDKFKEADTERANKRGLMDRILDKFKEADTERANNRGLKDLMLIHCYPPYATIKREDYTEFFDFIKELSQVSHYDEICKIYDAHADQAFTWSTVLVEASERPLVLATLFAVAYPNLDFTVDECAIP